MDTLRAVVLVRRGSRLGVFLGVGLRGSSVVLRVGDFGGLAERACVEGMDRCEYGEGRDGQEDIAVLVVSHDRPVERRAMGLLICTYP